MSDLLYTKDISKSYGEQTVLNNIDLHIPENKVYCLLGPNGAGKTTLMKIITGMISQSSGSIFFDGHEWSREDLKNIGSLIKNAPLYGNLTAHENLQVVARMRGVDDSRIDEVLEEIGLEDTGKKLTKNFSLGMKQRLGIGLALIDQPKLLILDEPTNGLDPIGIQQLRNLISEFKKQDMTVLISSHILSEVEHLADYIGIIGAGQLQVEKAYDQNEDLEKLFNDTLQKAGVI